MGIKGENNMIIFGIIIGLIIAFMLVGAVLHKTYYRSKLKQIKPYGSLVNVDDGQMHICSMGNGEKTIVLLPGMGVSLPSAEFAPLMRKLSQNYKVVCVEYFGIGFSSLTSKPRTCENYVEEIRAALSGAGYHPPYVLMPHSISSVISEYYAANYPREVEAIISLDGTSSAYYDEVPSFVKHLLKIAKFQQATGTTSLLSPLAVNKKMLTYGYTEKEIKDIAVFSGFTINDNVLEQMSSSADYIKQTMELPFPETIPYFKVISKKTYETPNKQIKITPQEYQHKHLERIGGHAKFEILEGTHFIYVNNSDRIAKIADELLLNTGN